MIFSVRGWPGRLEAGRSQMVGTVSHEFRNKCHRILELDSPKRHQYADMEETEARQLVEMAHQQPVDANEIVEDLDHLEVGSYGSNDQRRPSRRHAEGTVTVRGSKNRPQHHGGICREPSASAWADPLMVRRAIRNLIRSHPLWRTRSGLSFARLRSLFESQSAATAMVYPRIRRTGASRSQSWVYKLHAPLGPCDTAGATTRVRRSVWRSRRVARVSHAGETDSRDMVDAARLCPKPSASQEFAVEFSCRRGSSAGEFGWCFVPPKTRELPAYYGPRWAIHR